MGCHTWFYRPGRKCSSSTWFSITKRVNNKWYVEDAKENTTDDYMYHDLFRVRKYNEDGTYPEDILKSIEETKAFIAKQQIENVNWVKLEAFWKQYPDGIITFG